MPQKNIAVATLRKLLNSEIKIWRKKFLIQSRSFAEMLKESIRKYQYRAIEAATRKSDTSLYPLPDRGGEGIGCARRVVKLQTVPPPDGLVFRNVE